MEGSASSEPRRSHFSCGPLRAGRRFGDVSIRRLAGRRTIATPPTALISASPAGRSVSRDSKRTDEDTSGRWRAISASARPRLAGKTVQGGRVLASHLPRKPRRDLHDVETSASVEARVARSLRRLTVLNALDLSRCPAVRARFGSTLVLARCDVDRGCG